jgi:hypothetical protein
LKWFKITSSLLLILLFTACGNNDEDTLTNNEKKISNPVESKEAEIESDPSNTLTE